MIDLIGGLIPNLWGYVAAGVGALAVVLGAYFKGASAAKKKAELKQAKEHIATADRIDDVDEISDATDARDFLQSRGKR